MIREPYKWRMELAYLAALCLYLFLLFVNQTELLILLSDREQALIQKARYLCYLVFVIKLISVPVYSRRDLLFGLAAAVCVLLCVWCSHTRKLAFTALAVFAAYDCDGRRILRCAFAVFAAGLAATLLLCAAGVLQNVVLDASRNRQNLGFNWVTLAPIYCLFISIAWVNLRGARVSWAEILLMELCCVLLYRATNTRLTFLLNSVFLAVAAVELRLLHDRWQLLRALGRQSVILPLLAVLLVFAVQMAYQPSGFWLKLDDLLSERLSLAAQSFQSLPVKLFGQQIQWNGYSLDADYLKPKTGAVYNNVDCSYFRILFDYGIAGLVLAVSLYSWGVYQAAAAKDPLLVWSYLLVLVFCISEQWILELSFNYFPLVAAARLSPRPALPDRRIRFHAHAEGGSA
jgi:hypothetical protein